MPMMTPGTTPVYTFDLTGGEKLLRAAGACKVFDQLTGERPHVAKIRRLWTVGRLGLRLPFVVVGGTRYTSAEAIRWYIGATTALDHQRLDAAVGAAVAARAAPVTGAEKATLARFGIAEVG